MSDTTLQDDVARLAELDRRLEIGRDMGPEHFYWLFVPNDLRFVRTLLSESEDDARLGAALRPYLPALRRALEHAEGCEHAEYTEAAITLTDLKAVFTQAKQ